MGKSIAHWSTWQRPGEVSTAPHGFEIKKGFGECAVICFDGFNVFVCIENDEGEGEPDVEVKAHFADFDQLLSLHKVTEVAGGLEVEIVQEMMVKLPSLEDCGLNKIWDPERQKSASKLLSRIEVAVMQPKSLVLRQANGLHLKRENYGRSVKMDGKESFEIVGE